jgi:carbon storage regulator
MLILSRRIGETIMVGDDVAVTVLGIKGNHVRVGIAAPKDVSVHREEVYRRLKGRPPERGLTERLAEPFAARIV